MIKLKQIVVLILIAFVANVGSAFAQGWFHPGIDIEPKSVSASANMVYSTHAGFVTYAGPAPAYMAEKGWLVEVQTDFNRDNVPDIITRYTHLFPNALMVNDVSYRRETYTPEFYANYGRSLPFGNGPYVTRNQMIGLVGDSGSPGNFNIQYEIVTSRYDDLFGANVSDYNCEDDPYIEQCSEDASRPGLFFAINRKQPFEVQAPGYINPGIVTPIPARDPRVIPVDKAPQPELPEPGLPAPDFLPPPPPYIPPSPVPTSPPGVCSVTTNKGRTVRIMEGGQISIRDDMVEVPPGSGNFDRCGGHYNVLSTDPPCGLMGSQRADYGDHLGHAEGCNCIKSITVEIEEWGDCPREVITVNAAEGCLCD